MRYLRAWKGYCCTCLSRDTQTDAICATILTSSRQSYQMLFFATAKRTLFFYSPSSTQNVIAVGPCDQLLSAVAAARHGCGRSIGTR